MKEKIAELVSKAQRIVILQADNPDADSLGSALALEHILSDLGKDVALYCAVHIPDYLHYVSGWDRVIDQLPSQFDLSIIVDANTMVLFEKLVQANKTALLQSKPCIVIDHHANIDTPIDFSAITYVDTAAASTGDIIFDLSTSLGWHISDQAAAHIMTSILGDTQGLTNELTTARTFRTMASLTELGADRPRLESLRREFNQMAEKIFRYKATLITRTEFMFDNRIAVLRIPQEELNEYSPLYNPIPLIQPEMLQVKGVALGIVFKQYDDGKITAALRSNAAYPIAGAVAEAMGGGGHAHASGFKITDGRTYDEVKNECLKTAYPLIEALENEQDTPATVHTF